VGSENAAIAAAEGPDAGSENMAAGRPSGRCPPTVAVVVTVVFYLVRWIRFKVVFTAASR